MMDVMPVSEVIDKVAAICRANGVKRLDADPEEDFLIYV